MAINYQAMTTATGATAAVATLAQLEAMKALILANPAWSLADDTAVGTGNYRYVCFKNAASGSGLPNDYYVLFVYSSASAILSVYVGETYNAATHVLSGACGSVNGAVTLDAAARLPSPNAVTPTGGTGSPVYAGSAQFGTTYNAYVPATTVYWQAIVYSDHLLLGIGASQAGAGSSGTAYLGGYVPLGSSANDPYPITLSAAFASATSNAASTSREVLPLASSSRSAANAVYGLSGVATTRENPFAALGLVDPLLGGIPTTRLYLVGTVGGNGYPRGFYANIVFTAATIPSLAIGDTVLLNGTNWACVSASNGFALADTGA